MTQQFKAMKIRIKDATHSRMVQEALFEMGYKWATTGKNVIYTDSEVLWADGDGFISQSVFSSFHNYYNEEVELVTTHSFRPVDREAKQRKEKKEALEKNIAEMQKQLDEMRQKLESMT